MFNNNWREQLTDHQFTCDVELSFEDDTYIPKGTIVKGGKKFPDKDYTTVLFQEQEIDFVDWCLKKL